MLTIPPMKEILALSLGQARQKVEAQRRGPFGGPAPAMNGAPVEWPEEDGGPILDGDGFRPRFGRIGLDDDRSGGVDRAELSLVDMGASNMAPDEDLLNRALAARNISREELGADPARFADIQDEYHRLALLKTAAQERVPLDASDAVHFNDLYKTYQERRAEIQERQERRAAARQFHDHLGLYAQIQADLPPDATFTVDLGGGRKLTLKGGPQGLMGGGMLDAAQAMALADEIEQINAGLPPGYIYQPDLTGQTPGKVSWTATKWQKDTDERRMSAADQKLRGEQFAGLRDLRGTVGTGLKELLKRRSAAMRTDDEILAASGGNTTISNRLKAERLEAMEALAADYGPEMSLEETLAELNVSILEAQALDRVAQWQDYKLRFGQATLLDLDAIDAYYGVRDPDIMAKMDEMRRGRDWRGEKEVEAFAARAKAALEAVQMEEEMRLYNPYMNSLSTNASQMPPVTGGGGGAAPAPTPVPQASPQPGGGGGPGPMLSGAPTQGAANAAGNPTAPPVGTKYKKLTESQVRMLAREKGIGEDNLVAIYDKNGLLIK